MKAGTCRHFTGLLNKFCKQSIAYESVRREHATPQKLPCLGQDTGRCPAFDAYTEAEVAADEERFKAALARTEVIRKAIIATSKQSGEIDCPACGTGKVRFTAYPYRGHPHVHAACSTTDCARWME